MVRKLTFGTALLVLLALAVPATLMWWVAYTERGLQFAVGRLPAKLGNTEMHIEGVTGTLAGGIVLRRFTLEHELVSLRIEGVRGRVRILPLLWQSIVPVGATIDYAWIALHPRRTPPSNRALRFLPGFLSLRSDGALLHAATLVPIRGRAVDFHEVSADLTLQPKTLRFYRASGELIGIRLEARGVLTAADPVRLAGSVRAVYAPQGLPRWVLNGDYDGDFRSFAANGQLLEPFHADITGGKMQIAGDWSFSADARVHDFDLRPFGGGDLLGRITGQQRLVIDRNGYHARGTLVPAGLAAGLFDSAFDGSYADHVLTVDGVSFTHRASHAHAKASGRIGIVDHGPRLDLAGTWSNFRWPLVGAEPAVRSAAGRFTLADVWPYAVTTDGAIEAAGLAPMPLKLRGALAHDRFIVHDSALQIFDGTAQLAGEAQWSPVRRWSVSGPVRGLDPRHVRPDLPGKLDFQFAANGEGFDAASNLSIDVRDLQGRLRGTSARGAGHIAHRGSEWRFTDVDLTAGGVRLALDGTLGDTARDLSFRLDATDLGVLAEGSRGVLHSRGSLRGSAAEPLLRLDATGSNLLHAGVAMQKLEANVDFDPRAGHASKVTATARGIVYGERQVALARFGLDGRSEAHEVDFSIEAADSSVHAHGAGGFTAGEWRTSWDRLDIHAGTDVRLALEGALRTRMTTSAIAAERFCLASDSARLCGAGDWRDGAWQASVEASKLPLSTLTAGLTPQVVYEGTIDLTARAAAQAGAAPTGTLRAELSGAQLRHRRVNGRVDLIVLGSGKLSAEATPAALSADMLLDAGDTGRIQGRLTAQRTSPDYAALPLRAELRATTRAVGFVNLYIPEIDRAAGLLDAQLTMGGTLGAPLLNGVLRLSDGELDLYQINLALRGIGLEARLQDNGISFTGAARSGDGSVTARGQLNWRNGQPLGELALQGKDLLVVDVPEARVSASPDLVFKVDGRRIAATGTVNVPYARIVPADLTGAVVTSDDEVLVGTPPRKPEDTFQVSSSIRIVLGDHVSIDTFGLSGRLAGSITAQTSSEGASRGTGELGVTEGKYAALGRRLDIERGRLIFSGGLLADPAIDIRATKEFPDVKAGVNVRGTLREPRMTFFSEPSLPQSQIVSLILAGGTLETAQDSQRTGAGRNALLAQGGAILAQQLGSKIGIEDVGIEQNLANETSLVLGKYLSPRLYVSYGISLTEAINTLKMRYSLNDKWTVKTEAGREQSGDIVYTIEK